MAKQAGRCESCCGGLCGAEAVESCCEACKACPKRATRQFRSPIETAFGANREGTMAKPAGRCESCCGGCAVLKPSKAPAKLLRVLRPAQNVPRGSFEAQ